MYNLQKRTKILFVVTKSNFGGAQKYVYDLAISMPKDEFDVVVVLGGSGILVDKLRVQNIRVITIPSLARDINPLKDFASFFTLLKIFREEHPDVIHINSAKVGGLGALVGRIAGTPRIIFTAHGWAFNEDRTFTSRTIIKFLSLITVILSHKTIAVSQAVKNDTRNWPFIKKKVVVIPVGTEQLSLQQRGESRQHISTLINTIIPDNAFVVGTIAEFHRNKGLHYAIMAIAEILPKNPEIYYIILGNGEEQNALQNLIQSYNLQNHVFLVVMPKDAAQLLTAFDCFLLPSIKEGLPYVLLEAGLAKLPVIATSVGGIPEIIEHEVTGIIVTARDPKKITQALEYLIASPRRRDTLAHSLHTKVSRDFSLDRMLKETILLYTKD